MARRVNGVLRYVQLFRPYLRQIFGSGILLAYSLLQEYNNSNLSIFLGPETNDQNKFPVGELFCHDDTLQAAFDIHQISSD